MAWEAVVYGVSASYAVLVTDSRKNGKSCSGDQRDHTEGRSFWNSGEGGATRAASLRFVSLRGAARVTDGVKADTS